MLDGYTTPKDNRKPSTTDEIEDFENNPTAMNAILAGLDELEFYKVINYSTAKEIWYKLETMYHGDSKVQKEKMQSLSGQFEGLWMQEEENIAAYF